jgi:DNA polymerase-3 subunit delta'
LYERIRGQVARNKFPRFSILIGEKGCGKRTLAKEIGNLLNAPIVNVSTSVENIRTIIDDSYKLVEPIIYVIADCDNMSSAAANTLLKVTEEPPQQAYFILTCASIDNLLSTIKSRGVTYMLEPYTYEEKCDYLEVHAKHHENETFMLNVASNLGDLQEMLDIDVKAFEDYVELVIDNIADVSGSNAFKIGDKINFKDDKDKYDLGLFLRAFSSLCIDRMLKSDDPLKYATAVAITGNALQQLNIRGINKQMIFDTWLLDIRQEWL